MPADGIYGMTFVVCDALTGGACGAPVNLSVPVANGLYEAELPVPPEELDGADRFIEMTVNGEVLAPRMRLVSAPFAYTAGRLEGFTAADLDQSPETTGNAASIAAHTAAISVNAVDIATNAGNIAANAGATAANSGNIAAHAADIAANSNGIALNGAALAGKVSKTGDTIDGTLVLSPSSGAALVVTAGNVGIGTASPSSLLEVAGTMTASVLTITGGADIAEPFPISDGEPLVPGSVVIIDDENPGSLRLSERAYDTRVAGIVSGAGNVNPGLTLAQSDMFEDGPQVALSGRVFVLATAARGAIRPGDLLTTSDLPGHAMRADDPARAQGAVLGKAMTALDEGTGLVLVLVALQ